MVAFSCLRTAYGAPQWAGTRPLCGWILQGSAGLGEEVRGKRAAISTRLGPSRDATSLFRAKGHLPWASAGNLAKTMFFQNA